MLNNYRGETFNLDKEQIKKTEVERLQSRTQFYNLSARGKVHAVCQMLYRDNLSSELSGQVTFRTGTNTFLTEPFGLGMAEITPENLIEVDFDLNVVDGDGIPNPANRFHSWIYASRPDINTIIHVHPRYASALTMSDQDLVIAHMDTCILYNDLYQLKSWPGVPVGNEEGKIISMALEKAGTVLLSNHGVVCAYDKLELAYYCLFQVENAAKLQLTLADPEKIKKIDPDLALEAREWLRKPGRLNTFIDYKLRMTKI